ncbi:uncharacterized protein WM277_012005 isoform 1-T1 [Molossus nigricans]
MKKRELLPTQMALWCERCSSECRERKRWGVGVGTAGSGLLLRFVEMSDIPCPSPLFSDFLLRLVFKVCASLRSLHTAGSCFRQDTSARHRGPAFASVPAAPAGRRDASRLSGNDGICCPKQTSMYPPFPQPCLQTFLSLHGAPAVGGPEEAGNH